MGSRRVVRVLAGVLVWAAVAVPVALGAFLTDSRRTVVAGHEAQVRPTLSDWVVVELGPFLPSVRYPTPGPVGVHVDLGRTPADSLEELGTRYASLAAQPDGQVAKVASIVRGQAYDAALLGALAGLAPIGVWLLLGPRRRAELVASRGRLARTGLGGVLVVAVAVTVLARPWRGPEEGAPVGAWTPLADVLPAGVPLPAEARPLQVEAGLLSSSTQRLVESAVDSYRRGSEFYDEAAADLTTVADRVRRPEEGETVAVLVSDRHDNVGMDPVARAVADLASADVLLDAGDDTSTGSSWEAFSLESLDRAFDGFDQRFLVPGNHDNGDFVADQARDLGFTVLDGEVVETTGGVRLLGVPDPRSSGLGTWRDETGLSFAEVGSRLADAACAADADGERVATLLVHDANLGRETLRRGCADLVLGGHLHDVVGPDRVIGEDGAVGWSFTTGTTGGAAYAIAIGSKPRREATVSLVTYRDGRPLGVQHLVLSPLGRWTVSDFLELPLG